MRKARGFTLIELMIVIAILGILTAIAYPNYTAYLIKGNRSAAKQFMLTIANKEEQYLLDNRSYTNNVAALATEPSETSGKYAFSIEKDPVALPAPSYIITATAVESQASDGNLTLDSTGAKTPPSKW